MIFQVLRFGIAGGCVTAVSLAIYWVCAIPLGLPVLVANTIAYALSMAFGYMVHSRWTFAGQSQLDAEYAQIARFLVSNAVGFSLNSLWVWVIVEEMKLPRHWPMVPMGLITPLVIFTISRAWVFRSRA